MATRCGGFKVHWYTRDALSAPVKQDPPLLFNVDTDPSELYPLPNVAFQQVIDLATAYKNGFEASFTPAPSLFEFINLDHQACCCEATNCTCAAGYECDAPADFAINAHQAGLFPQIVSQ
jgi:hypothetical protein